MSYDPTIGRFVSEDPIKFDGEDADLYRYVRNDPTNAIDPTGLDNNYLNGNLIVDPGFQGPPGITYIPENEKQGQQPLPGPGTTSKGDAVILPGVGLIKIRASGTVVLKSYDPKTCTYTIQQWMYVHNSAVEWMGRSYRFLSDRHMESIRGQAWRCSGERSQ